MSRLTTKSNNIQANGNGQGFLPNNLDCVTDVLDALPFYVLLVDEDHYILLANKTVEKHLGFKPGEIVGKYCPKAIHGLDEPFYGCPLEEAAEKNEAVEREIFDQENGQWVMSAIYPTRRKTSSGKKIFLHLVIDITERKQADEKLIVSHERLRTLSAYLESVREEERKRIARDLHDETSQLLASLNAHLEAAVGMLSPDGNKALAILRKSQSISVNILDEIHRLIYELHPLQLDELGVVPAINSLIDNNLKADGLKVKVKTSGRVRRLSQPVEIAIYRVMQEALNNITRHSQATQVTVSMHFGRSLIRAGIQDNGKGFDVEEAISSKDRPRGYGLLSMRERVEILDGTFNIHSGKGGTKIDLIIPIRRKKTNE
jgi:PAS domain S-box-containing protein